MSATNPPTDGIELSLRIGQRVSHGDYKGRRVTGIVRGLDVSDERGLIATVLLDEPIVIPARVEGDREIRINWQTIPAHELAAFDSRDKLIAEMLGTLRKARIGLEVANERIEFGSLLDDLDATIAKAAGSAA